MIAQKEVEKGSSKWQFNQVAQNGSSKGSSIRQFFKGAQKLA